MEKTGKGKVVSKDGFEFTVDFINNSIHWNGTYK